MSIGNPQITSKPSEINEAFLRQAMKACVGVELHLHLLLTWKLRGTEWSASRIDRFKVGKRPLVLLRMRQGGWHCRSGRFGGNKNRLSLPAVETRFIGLPGCSPLTIHAEQPWLPDKSRNIEMKSTKRKQWPVLTKLSGGSAGSSKTCSVSSSFRVLGEGFEQIFSDT
jgi:hypothetical protein